VISPIFSNTTETNYFETNVTEVAFLNTAGVNIEMNNLTDEIQTKEPHKKMRSYNETSLKCKSWDNSLRIFKSDGCQAFVANETQLMCQTCDPSSITTTTAYH